MNGLVQGWNSRLSTLQMKVLGSLAPKLNLAAFLAETTFVPCAPPMTGGVLSGGGGGGRSRGGLGGWLRRVATNLCLDRLRKPKSVSDEVLAEHAERAARPGRRGRGGRGASKGRTGAGESLGEDE